MLNRKDRHGLYPGSLPGSLDKTQTFLDTTHTFPLLMPQPSRLRKVGVVGGVDASRESDRSRVYYCSGSPFTLHLSFQRFSPIPSLSSAVVSRWTLLGFTTAPTSQHRFFGTKRPDGTSSSSVGGRSPV